MTRVPTAALALGCLGLVPFIYGAALVLSAPGTWPGFGLFASSPGGGIDALEQFGAVILGFMGGCLCGFASAPGRTLRTGLLTASIVPAFLAFVAVGDDPARSCLGLAFGYVVLQCIDVVFHRAGVAPDYWLALRLPLTVGVIACLLIGALHG